MSKCKFEKKYLDHNDKKYKTFCCYEQPLKSGYCRFHDDKFLFINHENKKIIIEEIKNKIQNCIDNHKDLICIGFHIPEIKIKNIFSIPVYFNEAIFHGHVSFSESEFMYNVDFSYSKFLDPFETNFSRTKFFGKVALFEGAEFESLNLHFNGIEFAVTEKINFMITKFKNGVDFSNTVFSTKLIAFSRAHLFGSIHFSHTNFLNFEHISFNGTKFLKSSGLKEGSVTFFKSTFKGEGLIDFSNCVFETPLTFSWVNCLNYGLLDFTEVQFNRGSLGHSRFSGSINFSNCKFKSFFNFHFTQFDDPSKIFFRTKDLSNVSFIHTDLTRVNFSEDIRFGSTTKEQFKTLDESQIEKIIDSKHGIKKDSYVSYKSVIALYRNLRENYEFRLRYEEAGQFFLREMELKRIYKEKDEKIVKRGWFERNFLPIGIYYNLCRYGENMYLPLLWLLLLIVASSISWYIYFSFFDSDSINNNLVNFETALARTFSNLYQINEKIIWLDYFIRISSIMILGTFLISLRRKFERKFRH